MKMSDLLNIGHNKDILDEIRRNRSNIVPFIGAGVSAAYGYPTWKDLLNELSLVYLVPEERENLNNKDINLLKYAQKIVTHAGRFNIVVDTMRNIYQNCPKKNSDMAYILLKSFSNNIVTTNYDTVLENIYDDIQVLLPSQPEKMTTAIRNNQACILKMHGSIDEASSIIFSEDQYSRAYGSGKVDMEKALPLFLSSIFYGKSVLFIGCSLIQDRTMEVLNACLDKNEYIKNYAIVEQPDEESQQIKQKNHLANLGIIPIYYPKGNYKCVELLINYLAGENPFIQTVRESLSKYYDKTEEQYELVCSIMNETYYRTVAEYPEILNYDVGKDTFVRNLDDMMKKLHPEQSTYEICLHIIDLFANSCVLSSELIGQCMKNHFSSAVIRETDIEEYMRKKRAVYVIPEIQIEENPQSITKQADRLNRKIQFENDRDYSDYYKYYNQSVELLDAAYEKIEIRQRILLCNSVGAGYAFLKDPRKAIKYLNYAIDELLTMEDPSYSVLAMCYCNMSIIQAKAMENYDEAIEYIVKDLKIKQLINANKRLIAGSMGLLALYESEVMPFEAVERYIDVIKMKRNNIKCASELKYERDKTETAEHMQKKLILSWATSVFNLSLLVKDFGLYTEAEIIMEIANRYRYRYCPQNSFDYCASLNSQIELDIYLGKQDILKNANALQKRISMNTELNNTLFHSYYVLALYFYYNKDYKNAMKYISRYKFEYRINNASRDMRLEAKVAKLIMEIYISQNRPEEAKKVYDEIMPSMIRIYGEESIWLVPLKNVYNKIDGLERDEYASTVRFSEKLNKVEAQITDLYSQITEDLP